jgi:hypothetical protein
MTSMRRAGSLISTAPLIEAVSPQDLYAYLDARVLLRLWVLLWQRNRRAHGLGPQEREPAEQVLVPLDESALEQIEAAIAGRTWDTVVIGGGIRKPEPLLDFFEAVVNLVHVGAPTARIAFNSDGGSSLEAVQRVDA